MYILDNHKPGDLIEVTLDENKNVWLEAIFVRFVGETRVTVELKTPVLVIERTQIINFLFPWKRKEVQKSTTLLFTTFTTGLSFVREKT